MKLKKFTKFLRIPRIVIFALVFILFILHSSLLTAQALSSANNSATIVVGQQDFASSGNNQGGSAEANTIYSPRGVFSDGTRLYIADTFNHRVLIYNSIPTSSNASADVVVGQQTMAGNVANQNGSVGANTLNRMFGVFSDGEKLFIADSSNHRVLIYNHIPTANNANADIVVGQTGMDTATSGTAINKLKGPTGVYYDGTKLFIVDSQNNRVLIFNHIPSSNGASADVVVGQADMDHGSANQSGTTAANTINSPQIGVTVCNGKLLISDWLNNRVLIFNQIPASNNANANVVIGQTNMTSNSANQSGSANSNTLNSPFGIACSEGRLFIDDVSNNRILVYNQIPTSNNASADAVIGQPDMTSNSANQGVATAANTVNSPRSVWASDNKVYVSDLNNNRIIIFNLGHANTSLSSPSTSTSREVVLNLTASEAKEIKVSENSDFSGASWESYSASKNFSLSSGDGTKTLYVKMRDYVNYESSVLSSQILLDTEKPTVRANQSTIIAAGTKEVNIEVETSENSTCKYGTSANASYTNMANTFSSTGGVDHQTTISDLSDGNSYHYYIRCQDQVGNINENDYEITFAVSSTKYIPTIFIGSGNQVINLSPTEQALTRVKEIAFRGTLTDNDLDLGKVELRKDGKFYKKDRIGKNGKWRIPTKDNPKQRDIPHTYQFIYYDKSGNIVETSNTYTILIDRQKPKFTKIAKTQIKFPSDTVTFGATDNDQIDHYNINFRGQKSTSPSPELIIPENTPAGTPIMSVETVDRAGNIEKIKLRIKVVRE